MAKQRIGVLVREAVGGSKTDGEYADLKTLTAKYNGFKQALRSMIIALDKHFMAINTMEFSRVAVANSFAAMSKATPLWDATGLKPNADHPADTVCSYASVHEILGAKTKGYAQKYKQFVLDYATEWEKTVVTRIDNGIKKTEELRKELNHYQKKVEALRLTVNQSMAKGKSVKSDVQERLRRNEEKFLNAKQLYNRCATDLCILMEEVVERSWRDLHSLVVKSAQFDSTLASDESNILASLNQVVSKLKEVGVANGISPQPRLKDLGTLKPELLSTRPGGVGGLAIENGPGDGGVFGTGGKVASPTNYQAIAPGATAASGLGGFPVIVGSSNDDPLSSMDMMSISQSSAPPPTFDDIYSSNHNALSTRSAPSSGNLPNNFNAPGRNHSSEELFSFAATPSHEPPRNYSSDDLYGAYSAPGQPNMPPPPPPSGPPPPPPPGGFYGMPPSSSYAAAPGTMDLYGSQHAPPPASSGLDLGALYSAGSSSTTMTRTTSSNSPTPSWSAGGASVGGGYDAYGSGAGAGGFGGNTYSQQPIMSSSIAGGRVGSGTNPFDM